MLFCMPKQLHLGDFSMVISQSQGLEPQSIAVNATQDANAFHFSRKCVGKWNHNIKSVAQWTVSMVLAGSVQSTEKALVYGQSSWTDMCIHSASQLSVSVWMLLEEKHREAVVLYKILVLPWEVAGRVRSIMGLPPAPVHHLLSDGGFFLGSWREKKRKEE